MIETIPARMRLLIGNHALSIIGFQEPSSLTGNQSYLFSIQLFSWAFAKNPFRALNCSARQRTKNVGIARMGAIQRALFSGSEVSRIVSRMTQKVKNANNPPITGLATQDMTTFSITSQSIREVPCWTSMTKPTPTIPPMML